VLRFLHKLFPTYLLFIAKSDNFQNDADSCTRNHFCFVANDGNLKKNRMPSGKRRVHSGSGCHHDDQIQMKHTIVQHVIDFKLFYIISCYIRGQIVKEKLKLNSNISNSTHTFSPKLYQAHSTSYFN